jgi:hypothetical protein
MNRIFKISFLFVLSLNQMNGRTLRIKIDFLKFNFSLKLVFFDLEFSFPL